MSLAHSIPFNSHLLNLARSTIRAEIDYAINHLRNDILNVVDSSGNTFLHLAVIHNTVENVEFIINSLREKTLLLCKTVNKAGKIPLYLAHEIGSAEHRLRLINLLLPLSLEKNIKPLNAPVNEQEVLNEHPEAKDDKELEENLKLGCRAANAVIMGGVISATHPEFNFKSEEEKIKRVIAINTFRNSLSNRTFTFSQYKKEVDVAKAQDCDLLALNVISYVMEEKKYQTYKVELISMEPGGHSLVLLDREKGSKLKESHTYGRKAVFVDAWAREVYHPRYLRTKLKGHLNFAYYNVFKYSYNFLTRYNQEYHRLHSILKYKYMCAGDNSFEIEKKQRKVPTLSAGTSSTANDTRDFIPPYIPTHEDFEQALRLKKVDLAELDKPNAEGDTLAVLAALKNHVATLEVLGERNANLNIQSKKGCPVTIAAEHGYLPSLRVLTKFKADLNASINGLTAFYLAVQNNKYSIVEFLTHRLPILDTIPQRLMALKVLNEEKATNVVYRQCCDDIARLDSYAHELLLMKTEVGTFISVSSAMTQIEKAVEEEYQQVTTDLKSSPIVHRDYCLSLKRKISEITSLVKKEISTGFFANKNKEKLISLIIKAEQKCFKEPEQQSMCRIS